MEEFHVTRDVVSLTSVETDSSAHLVVFCALREGSWVQTNKQMRENADLNIVKSRDGQ